MVYSLRRKNRSHKKKRNKLEGVNVVGDIETIKEENTTVEYQSQEQQQQQNSSGIEAGERKIEENEDRKQNEVLSQLLLDVRYK